MAAAPLPRYTGQLVQAVRSGRGGGFFPPVMRAFPEGVEAAVRELGGARDAARIAAALAGPAFAPLVAEIERLGAWCAAAAARHAALFAPGVLAVDNSALFGAVVSESFVACAAARRRAPPHPALALLFGGARAALARFLRRLARDLRGALGAAGVRGPVRALWMCPEETHNGRQSVIRAELAAGGAWAYKPRPASGERLFLADTSSVFARINALPAASGDVRLPTLRVLPGGGRDGRAYSWQEWIEPPRQWGTIRRARSGLRLAACRLRPREAEPFWHRAGALAAACFAFGAADLYAGNLVVGRRRGAADPLAYPIDLEVFFAPFERLIDTGLVADERDRGNHHVGFERLPRWCTAGGPIAGFVEDRGGLELRRRARAWGRREASSVVADTRGRVGFGAYASAYLRGMFDLWTKLVTARGELAALLARASRGAFVRVLVRPTAAYAEALDRWLLAAARPGSSPVAQIPRSSRSSRLPRFSREERAQLGRLDVPYFFRRAGGGPLLWLDPATGAHRIAGRQPAAAHRQPPSASVRAGERLALIELGVALRDAIAYAFPDLPRRALHDPRRGVRITASSPRRGSVAFDWPEVDRRLTYAWRGATVTLEVAALAGAVP